MLTQHLKINIKNFTLKIMSKIFAKDVLTFILLMFILAIIIKYS